jgi:hypothetical protein
MSAVAMRFWLLDLELLPGDIELRFRFRGLRTIGLVLGLDRHSDQNILFIHDIPRRHLRYSKNQFPFRVDHHNGDNTQSTLRTVLTID